MGRHRANVPLHGSDVKCEFQSKFCGPRSSALSGIKGAAGLLTAFLKMPSPRSSLETVGNNLSRFSVLLPQREAVLIPTMLLSRKL